MDGEFLRIAAFGGFRTIPPEPGGAGSDKFALELYPRIAAKGHLILAYTRNYNGREDPKISSYQGVKIKQLRTIKKAGFDTLVHSFKATWDIIFNNSAEYVHIQSGANSFWAIPLRLAGKKVALTQFAMDWKRDKWPWYSKLFYLFSNIITAYVPSKVVCDNIFIQEYFEKKYNRSFSFIPYGCEVSCPSDDETILEKLGLIKNEYFLFIGRFIPDKGLHLLVDAFEKIKTEKKLVLIGGSPNPGNYEKKIKSTKDDRIIIPGYIYGDESNILIKNAYAYIQPSLIEGLSPMILTVMGLGTSLICSDIKENIFITGDNAITFESGNSKSLEYALKYSLDNFNIIRLKALQGKIDVTKRFNWDKTTDLYIEILSKS